MWTPELCPYCRSRDLTLEWTTEMGNEITRLMKCACGKKFVNSFTYRGYYEGKKGFILKRDPIHLDQMPQYSRSELEGMSIAQIHEAQKEMYDWADDSGLIVAASKIAVIWDQGGNDEEYVYEAGGARWISTDDGVYFDKMGDDGLKTYLDTQQQLAVLQDWWVELTFELAEKAEYDDQMRERKKEEERKREIIRRLTP